MIRYICSLLTLFLVVGVLAGQTTTFFPFKVNASIGVFNSGGSGDYIGFVGTVGTTGFIVDSVRVNDVLVDDTGKQFRVVDFTVTVPGSIVQLEVDAIGGGVAPLSGRGSLVRPSPFYKFLPITQDGSNYITAEQQTKMLNNNAYRMDSVMNAQYVQLSQLQLNAGSNRDTITQALHGFSVSTTKFRPVRVTGDETWLGTSALGEAFFPDAYVVDSIDGNTFAIQYSGALTTVGWHGYVPGSTLYLGDTFGAPQTTPGTIPVIVASVPDSNTIILMPMPVLVPSTGTTNLTTARTNTVDSIKSSSGADVVLERAIKYSAPPASPSTTTEKTTLHVDPTGEIFKAFDTEIDVHVPVRFDYTVSGVADVRNLKAANGRQIEVRSTNTQYIVQAATPVGYTHDSTAVVQLASSNYAVIQSDIIYDLEDWGIVAGTGLSLAQRTENWRRFKKLHDFAFIVNNGRLNIKLKESKTYEFHIHNGSGWTAPAKDLVIDIDFGGSSLIFYPLVPQYYELIFQFTSANTIKMNVRNGNLLAFRPSRETYEATIKPSGNLDTIILTSSAIRTAFDSEVNGKQILVSYDYDKIADTITVTDYNPITKILTLSRNINLPSATSDDAGWIGVPWLQTTNVDTINLYRAYWVESDNGGDTGLDYGWFSPQSAKKMEITFSKIKTEGFSTFFSRSGGDGTMRFEQSDLSAHVIVATNYHNTPVYGVLQVEDCYVHDTGYESKGHHPLNISGASDRYNAGTFYTHPNAKVLFNNVRFKNAMVSLRQYSAGADKPLTDFKHHSEIRNCEFIDQQDQYHIYTSDRVPTIISNCYFNGNNVWLRGHTIIENTIFDTVNIASFESQLPGETYVKIENSIMRGGTRLSASGEADELEKWVIRDSKWEIPVNLSGNYFGGTTQPDSLIIENTTFYRNSDTNGTFGGFFQSGLNYARFRNVDIDLHPNDEIFQRWSYVGTDAIFENVKLISGRFSALSQVSSGVRPFKIKGIILPDGSENSFGSFIFLEKEFESNYNSNTVSNSTLTFTSPSTITLPSASTFRLSGNYNHHKIDGIAKRIIFSSSTTDWSSQTYYRGLFTLECDGAGVTIPAYNSATADSTSNFTFDLDLSDGELKQVYFDPYSFAVGTGATSTMTDELIGTTTTAKNYTLWNVIDPLGDVNHGYRIIPGTVIVKINGVTFGTDDGRGNISGALGAGSISYFKNYVELRFTSTPTAGEAITITSDYVNRADGFHYVGAFYDPANIEEGIITGNGNVNEVAYFSGSTTSITSSPNFTFTGTKVGINSIVPTDFLEVSGTRTATVTNETVAEIAGSLTASSTSGHAAGGLSLTSTVSAGANNQVLRGLLLGNTFNTGAFTGISTYDLSFSRNNPIIHFSSGSLTIRHNANTNEQLRITSTSVDHLLPSSFASGSWSRVMNANGSSLFSGYDGSGRFFVGTVSVGSFPTLTAQMHLRGVDTGTTDALYVENSAATKLLELNNDGRLGLGMTPVVRLDITETNADGIRVQTTGSGSVGGTIINADGRALQLQGKSHTNGAILDVRPLSGNGGDIMQLRNTSSTVVTKFDQNAHLVIGAATLAASAALELVSTTKGFLPPRMTTTQKNAIASPAEGLEVFDTDLDKKQVYIGSTWESVYSGDVYKTHNFLSDANEIFGTSPQYLDTLYNYGFTVGQDIAGKQLVEISFSLLDETTDDFDIRVIYYDVSAGTLTPLATATIANGAHTVTQTGLSQVLSMGDHLLLDVVDPGTDVTARAYVTSTLRIKTN